MKRIALLAALALSTVAHAQVKISELPPAGALTGAEVIPVVQSGTTAKSDLTEFTAYNIAQILARANVWSGQNVWSNNALFTFSGTAAASTINMSANTPQLEWHVANGNTDTRRWMAWANVTNMHFALCNDAGNSCNDYLTVVHDGVGTPTGVTITPLLTTTKGITDNWLSTALQASFLSFSNDPQFELWQANGVANQARWNFRAQNGFVFRMLNNAGTTATNVWAVAANAAQFNVFAPSVYSAVSTALAPTLAVSSTNPQFEIIFTGGATDAKRWNNIATTNGLQHKACNDAGNSCGTYMNITRSGPAITAMAYGHTNATTHSWTGSAWSVGGNTGTTGQVLTSNGNATAPTWQTPSAGGSTVVHKRTTIVAIAASSTAGTIVTWTTPFADTNYTVNCTAFSSAQSTSTPSIAVSRIATITAASITVAVENKAASASSVGELHCMAIHD